MDNGIFKAKEWIEACTAKEQGLTFAAVNAHFQNGICEKRIRDLQDITRTQLIHAHSRWQKCITAHLWAYALRHSNNILNNTPNPKDKQNRTAQELFDKSAVNINKKHWQPFGCPVYVLNDALAKGKPYNKWKQRSRVGIYLGMSPLHARNVALVLDQTTGLVSPQFHVTFDASFRTVKQLNLDSKWQEKAYFVSQKGQQIPQPVENTTGRKDETHPSAQNKRPAEPGSKPVSKRQKRVQFSIGESTPSHDDDKLDEIPKASLPKGASQQVSRAMGAPVKTRSGRNSSPAE